MIPQRYRVGNPYPKTNNPTPIYIGHRVIGQVVGDTFHKSIVGSKHLLQRPKAICFDRSTLRDAAEAGATRVEIYDRESGAIYTATLETIHAHSFAVRRGFGDQIGVTLDYWSINGAVPHAERTIQGDGQLSLFGEVG